ncbi:ABC transporter permease [Actinomadura logoneensis]|uniref:ABC transporter permease n=1 Tax=Actinomadura logoneensis TaxID=2293572 RepID=UPI001F279BA6|nr:ABC transporter permease [Actinomadura logoneensis]
MGVPLFLALREIRAARGRFLLMGLVVMLVAALVGIVSGFTTGLGNDTVSALRALPATHVAFAPGAKSDQFNRSLVDASTVARWRERPGVEAAPLGVTIARGTTDRGLEIDMAAFGVEPGTFPAPPVRRGTGLDAARPGLVVSGKLASDGVRVGDTVTVDRLGLKLPVTGVTDDLSYGHVPAVYLPLDAWRAIRFGVPGAATAPDRLPQDVSGVALRARPGADLAGADRALGTLSLPMSKVLEAAPGYKGERVTMTSIQVFLYLIAPLIVGAFFAVWTVQRAPELALLRAIGASRRRLLSYTVLQAALVVAAGTVAGGALALATGLLLGAAVPFSLPAGTLAGTLAAVALVGLAGTCLTLRRVTTPDPLTMLGAAR